jgi:uncharacterized protein (TIGR04222 family)
MGPFDLTGGPFLALYSVLFVLAAIASLIIPRWLRPEGRWGRLDDTESLAFLAGGPGRFAETVVARLLSAHSVSIHNKTKLKIGAATRGQTSAERLVLGLASPVGWRDITKALEVDSEAVQQRLSAKGLVIDAATGWQMRFWQTVPLLALLAFGLIKWDVGTSRDRPVEYLIGLMILTAIVAIIRFALLDRRTGAGVRALEDARLGAARLRSGPTTEEAGLAVALFGTSVLAGSMFANLHQLRRGDSGGDSGTSSDGDGGCGGGGCGGCGS